MTVAVSSPGTSSSVGLVDDTTTGLFVHEVQSDVSELSMTPPCWSYTMSYIEKQKFSRFCPRVVNVWNSLPDCIVDADNTFKALLDKFWRHQDMLFDYKAELTGIRSIISVLSVREASCSLMFTKLCHITYVCAGKNSNNLAASIFESPLN